MKPTRLESLIDMVQDCGPDCHVIWPYSTDPNGFGRVHQAGFRSPRLVHRVAYEFVHGEIPKGHVVIHTCTEMGCVNPSHLRAVTWKQNGKRKAARTTVCLAGHSYSEPGVNKKRTDQRHDCRLCQRERDSKRSPRQRRKNTNNE